MKNEGNNKLRQVDIMYKIKTNNMQFADTVLIFKSGNFYTTFDEDAEIISYLNQYKLVKKSNYETCGFPVSSLDGVTQNLEMEEVNYNIYEKVGVNTNPSIKKDYKRNNRYEIISTKASKENSRIKIKNNIVRMLENILEMEYGDKYIRELEKQIPEKIKEMRRKYENE